MIVLFYFRLWWPLTLNGESLPYFTYFIPINKSDSYNCEQLLCSSCSVLCSSKLRSVTNRVYSFVNCIRLTNRVDSTVILKKLVNVHGIIYFWLCYFIQQFDTFFFSSYYPIAMGRRRNDDNV